MFADGFDKLSTIDGYTIIMASTRQKVIGASSSAIIFVALIGILSYIQDKNLNLSSYLQTVWYKYNTTYQNRNLKS